MQKGFAQVYLLIILLVVGAVGGAYYFGKTSPKTTTVQPTPTVTQQTTKADETASLKTYVNKDYSFSFKYPANYTVTEKKETFEKSIDGTQNKKMTVNQYYYTFSTGKMVNGSPDWSGFLVNIWPTFGQDITQEFGFSREDKKNCPTCELTFVSQNNGADESAITTSMNGQNPVYRYKDNFFQIGRFNGGDNVLSDKSDLPDYSQIYSTFKFTDRESGETSSWKTYTNTKYGYTVQYPEGWKLDSSGLSVGRIRFIEKDLSENNPYKSVVGIIGVEVSQSRDYTNWTYERYLKLLDTGGKSEGEMGETQDVKKLGPTKIDGIDGYLSEWGCCGGRNHGAIILHRGRAYMIYLSAGGNTMLQQDVEAYSSILNKVFSTFKFLD